MAEPYEAQRETNGGVRRLKPLTRATAVLRRQAGLDVVVCGPVKSANRKEAEAIEAVVGPCQWHSYHDRTGALGLPHWQQISPPPAGHTFYEVDKRKAASKP